MKKRIAIIDLGTNTFNLLIVEQQANKTFKSLHSQRCFVKLAEEGIKTIGTAPLQRALNALRYFHQRLQDLEVQQFKAIGTAALRTATNGPAFVEQIKSELGISIEIISGLQEACYIHKGVSFAVPFEEKNYLLMDIGGGSVEFILANQEQVHWAQSYPIGVGILLRKFHKSDPIQSAEIQAIKTYLDGSLSSLKAILQQYPTTTLVGDFGTFGVFKNLLTQEQVSPTHAFIQVSDFFPLYDRLIRTTKAERSALQEVPDPRADVIVVAMILIHYILKELAIDQVIVSKYAMKEGILLELMTEEVTSFV